MLELSEEVRLIAQIFTPIALEELGSVVAHSTRFVHYTSADTAYKILSSKSVWMRNAITMNDFSEISYGRDCLFDAYRDNELGQKLKAFMEDLYPGFSAELEKMFDAWLPQFQENTYITSISVHDKSEDELGRLSMWRAYCPQNGVAIVINNYPFVGEPGALGAFSSPVSYFSRAEFKSYFARILQNIAENSEVIKSLSREQLISTVFHVFKMCLFCTKHPGFREEQEWRVIYSPTFQQSDVIIEDFASIRGVPQQVYKIPLLNDPEKGLDRADIPNLIERIIVGPTTQPLTIWKAMVRLLEQAGVQDAGKRVVISDIPLRTE